ncbi:MAG TPA: glycogen debranching N-terminal domain-containing protein [Candidatus Acidoferrales bacterium]
MASSDFIKIRPRQNTVQISRGRTAFVFLQDGTVTKARAAEGLYVYQTRVLSKYAWRLNGKRPEFSCGSNTEQFSWIGYYVQTPENCKDTPTGECDPLQQTLEFRLHRSVGEGLHEDVEVTNHTQISTKVRLELEFEYQFVSREEVDDGRKQFGALKSHWSQPTASVWELMTEYHARHHYSHQENEGDAHFDRGLKLRIENCSSEPKYESNRLSFEFALGPHESWQSCLSWLAYVEGGVLPLCADCKHMSRCEWDSRRELLLSAMAQPKVPSSGNLSGTVGRVLARSRADLADLRLYDLDTLNGIAVAAGIPSYMGIFGRDLQASSWEATILGPEMLRGSLQILSELQACETNDWRDAQPGRIAHEVHTDPLSVLNFRPKTLYFGSVSSSFLYPILVSELWHWTGDLELVRKYAETAIRAIRWADEYSLDSTGFYRYQTRSEQGMKNQGWKDSGDAIVYPDGSQVPTPIGTCEMQGFMYVAKLHFSEVLWWLGQKDLARQLFREAEDLKSRFNEKFWMDEERYFALGIDAKGELIRSVASDPGHCLLSGIVDKTRIRDVAARMMRDDLFTGGGVRTLSSQHRAYNPFSYHRGSVWPVENAAFALAFSRYGLHDEMHRLAKAIFEAANLFEYGRLPEVFGGHQRNRETPFPGLYTKADWPQAWSASAPVAILQALAGIYPYAPEKVLFLDPQLPGWLPEISLEGLRVGEAVVTLRFFRKEDGSTDYEIVKHKGTLHIVKQPSPWSVTSGWVERIQDLVASIKPRHKKAPAKL